MVEARFYVRPRALRNNSRNRQAHRLRESRRLAGALDLTEEKPGEISESDILTPTNVLRFRILQQGEPPTTRVQ